MSVLCFIEESYAKRAGEDFGDIYNVLKGIIVKDPSDMGPFTKAYYAYFLHIPIKPGQTLEDAILRSETFQKWKTDYVEEADRNITDEELVNTFWMKFT